MNPDQIVAIIVAALSAGGVGGAVISALANREKVQAEATMTLSEGYETRIANLTKRATVLECRLDEMDIEMHELNEKLSDREANITALQRENEELRAEVARLRNSLKGRDKQIRELERQVSDLTARLNAYHVEGGLV